MADRGGGVWRNSLGKAQRNLKSLVKLNLNQFKNRDYLIQNDAEMKGTKGLTFNEFSERS